MTNDHNASTADQPFEVPINGILDLHTFQPREAKDLLPEYLEECRKQGMLEVRIIHGNGVGVLRETVHSVLRHLSYVLSFKLAGENAGGWGATLVRLRASDDD